MTSRSTSLTFDLLAKDKTASSTFSRFGRNVDQADSKMKKIGSTFASVGKTAAAGLAVGVAAAGAALVAFGKQAVDEAREAQKVGAQTEAVIKSTGAAAKVTADHVAGLAEKLSLKAGVDDEVIQSGENLLLTFTSIRNEMGKGNAIFDRATTLALDMSVALGKDMRGATLLVAKALNDPIKGMSSLSRVGITFTEQQQKQIEKLVEEGRVLKAQKIILGELDAKFKGSAEAQATAGAKASVAWGNFQEMVGAKLLPLLDRLAVFFVTVIVPALQRFAAWFEREGIPVIRRFADQASKWIGMFVNFVREHWPEISRVIREVLRNVVEIVRGIVALVRAIWDKWGEDILRVAKVVFGFIIGTIRSSMKVIRGVIDVVTGLIKGDWDRVWDGIRAIFGAIWDQIKNVLKTALKAIREIIRNAWDAVKDISKRVWNAIRDLVALALSQLRDKIRDLLDTIRDRIVDVWNAIRDKVADIAGGIRDRVTDVFGAMRDRLANIWDAIRDKISGVWTGGIRPVFNALKDAVGTIPRAFEAATSKIGAVWTALKKTVGSPVYFVLNTIWNNGLAAALDKIPGVGDWSVDVSDIPHWRKGGWTGPGSKDKIAGFAHAREFVINADATERIERTNPGFLESLNKTGLPGHKSGGFVDPMKRVYVDGEPLTAVHAAQLLLAGSLMGARQSVMQGSWQAPSSYSGTSHTGPGVADTSPGSFTAQAAQRRAGIAAWARNIPGAAYAGSGAHVHGISMFSAPGNSQLASYFAGGDGLGGSDYGPRPPLLPGLMGKLSQFRDLALSGGIIPALMTGLFKNLFGAATATPDFGQALADAQDKIDGMKAKGGWPSVVAKAPASVLDEVAEYGRQALKDAGAWMENKVAETGVDVIGEDAANITKAWNAIEEVDLPGGWWGNGLKGGIYTKPTVIGVGDKGPERVDVTPLRDVGRGGTDRPRRMVIEGPVTFDLGGAQITRMIRLIAREELEDEFQYQVGG